MNREIKFRAFDTENKEMLEVQELDYEDSWNGQPMVRTTMYNDYFDTEEMILMQYTGLKDKNGVEIYEGDIVKIELEENKYFTTKIQWEQRISGFIVKDVCLLDEDVIRRLETIGNIYDNPELIEKEGK